MLKKIFYWAGIASGVFYILTAVTNIAAKSDILLSASKIPIALALISYVLLPFSILGIAMDIEDNPLKKILTGTAAALCFYPIVIQLFHSPILTYISEKKSYTLLFVVSVMDLVWEVAVGFAMLNVNRLKKPARIMNRVSGSLFLLYAGYQLLSYLYKVMASGYQTGTGESLPSLYPLDTFTIYIVFIAAMAFRIFLREMEPKQK